MTPSTLRDSLLQTAFITLTFTALPLSAATLDWDGTTSTDLTLNTNWLTDVLPANDLTTDIARFTGTAPANQPTLNAARSINGLIFDGTGYNLGGTGTLTLGAGGIQVSGTGTNTISVLLAGTNVPVSVASGATLDFSRSANTTFAQNISGAGNVIFSGTNNGSNNQSSHILSGTNTGLTAAATITANNSRVSIDNVADVGSARLINTNNGQFYFTNNATISNAMTIQGIGWGEGAGNLGAIRMSGGTLSGAITLAGNSRITAHGNSGTISGIIGETGGARSLEIGGSNAASTITLSGLNTYTGGTTVKSNLGSTTTGSTLILNANSGGTGTIRGNVTVESGATLQLNVANALGYAAGQKVETLTINGGNVVNNVANQDNGWGLDIVMTGGTISGTGRFSMGRGSVSDDTSVTTNASANTATISVAAMTLRSGNSLTGVNFTVADGAAATDLLVSSSLQAAGTAVGINKLGTGTMVLSGASTYAGATNVNAGTLILNSTGSIASSAVAVANGATFQMDRTGKTIAGLSLAGGSRLNIAAGVGETTTSTGALTLSGGTVDVALDLRTPIFTGQTINLVTAASTTGTAPTFNTILPIAGSRITGTTSMVGNNLQFAATTGVANLIWNNAAGDGIWNTNGSDNFLNGASNDEFFILDAVTFQDGAATKNVAISGTVAPSQVTVNNTAGGGAYTFGGTGTLSGTGTLIKNGDGTLTLGGAMTYGIGRTTVNNGTFDLGGKTVTGVESFGVTGGTVTNGTVNATTFDLQGGTVAAVLAGGGTLNKSTAGTTVLTGTNTLSGPSNVTAGTLQIGNGGTSGALGTSAVAVSAGATVAFNRSDANTVANAFSGAGTLQKDGANNMTLSGALAQNLVINSGTVTKTGGGFSADVMTGNGLVTVNSGATLVLAAGSSHAFGGNNASMTESFVINGGTMTVNQEQYFNNLTLNGATVNTTAGSEIRASNATNFQVTGTTASLVSSNVSNNGAANWTVADVTSSSAADLTVSGAIINTGALNKAGAGTMAITGVNTYTGATNVNAGTLQINGNSVAATGMATVAAGATLGGTGTYGGALNVTGTLAPGASIESLATGAVTLNAASHFSYELNSSNLTGDLLAVTGGLNIGTGALLDISDLSSVARTLGDKLTLINYSGSWNGGVWNGYADDSTFQLGSNTWQISYDDQLKGTNFNSEQLGLNSVTITVVPEPSVALLGSLGVMALLRRRRNE